MATHQSATDEAIESAALEPERAARQALNDEREDLLEQVQAWLEVPMLVLAFVWLGLFVAEMVYGVSPLLEYAGHVIWAAFVLEFVLGFVLAPGKFAYLRSNWLKLLAVAAPALRLFRIVAIARLARTARVARSLRLLRLVSSLNRGMKALGASFGRRGFGYVLVFTVIVLVVGAAGMYGFERDEDRGLDSYGAALWWTAMLLTTMGSEYWPKSPEGRLLCLFLAIYSFSVFGFVTATLATHFIGRDAADDRSALAGHETVEGLRREIAALREEIHR